jgi:hypothetical protein
MPRKPITKKAFVAGLPETLSNAETVAKAKAIGLTLTQKQVSKIRSSIRIALKANGTYIAPTQGPKLRKRNGHSNGHAAVISPNGEQEILTSTANDLESMFNVPSMLNERCVDHVGALKKLALQIGLTQVRQILNDIEEAILRPT